MTVTEHTPAATDADRRPADESAEIDAVDTELTDGLVEDDVLVEEISIDGMCGVY